MIGGRDFFFFRTLFAFFHILKPLFLPPSSVSFSYFILAVPMRKCLGKHSCMSSPFPIAILNGTFFFRSVKAMNNWKRSAIKQILLLLLLLLSYSSLFPPSLKPRYHGKVMGFVGGGDDIFIASALHVSFLCIVL